MNLHACNSKDKVPYDTFLTLRRDMQMKHVWFSFRASQISSKKNEKVSSLVHHRMSPAGINCHQVEVAFHDRRFLSSTDHTCKLDDRILA